MKVCITKSARQFGYLIWNKKLHPKMEQMLCGREIVHVNFNGFDLGEKLVDRRYYRISLGFKLTRALPENHNMFSVVLKNDILEVKSFSWKNQ